MNKKQKSMSTQAGRGRLRRELVRVTEYLVSGGLYFWTGYLIFFIADHYLGWNLFWAKMVSNVVGWSVNYTLQILWVFRNPALSKHRIEVSGKYIFITIVDFFLDYLIVWALAAAGLTPYIGQFVSAGFFTVWNYLWYKFWVFTNRVHRKPKVHPGVPRSNKQTSKRRK
jgi:putative flippase GtrA